MLIKDDSIFQKIPIILDKKQVYLIEGIRYCANSISLSYISLVDNLSKISERSSNKSGLYYSVYKEAWAMIDSTYRLTCFISALSVSDGEASDDFKFLLETKSLRNTFEHLDERIDEIIVKINAPLWGNISWLKVIDDQNGKLFYLSAGHPNEKFESILINPSGKLIDGEINCITLETIQRKKDDHVIILDLSELYKRTEKIIQKMTHELEAQLTPHLIHGKYAQDILLTINIHW